MAATYAESKARSTVSPAFRHALDHMNNDHKHQLSHIVSHHLKLSRPPTRVRLSRLDEKGFEVEYEQATSFWRRAPKMGVRILWEGDKTVTSGRETRPLLVKLSEESVKDKADKRAGIIYSVPPELPLFLVGYLFLHYISTTQSPTHLPSKTLTELYVSLHRTLRLERNAYWLLQTIFAVHALEALGMLYFVLQVRKGPLDQAILWAVTTVPVGFPTFLRFRALNKAWSQ